MQIHGIVSTQKPREPAIIFEKGGKHVETIIDGMPESEYNELKEKYAKRNEEDTEIKGVVSFSWKK